MKISMAEVNKKANLIINEAARSGETVVVHGEFLIREENQFRL